MKSLYQYFEALSLTSPRVHDKVKELHAQIDAQIKAIQQEGDKAASQARLPFDAQIKELVNRKERLTTGIGGKVKDQSYDYTRPYSTAYRSHEFPKPPEHNTFDREFNKDKAETYVRAMKGNKKAIAV